MKGSQERFIRKPFVAGQFYEGNPIALKRQVERYINREATKQEALAVVAPHAGLIYSGAVAGAVYSSVIIPDRLIILGPNHTGLGAEVSVHTAGLWETPIGNFEIDEALAEEILSRCGLCSSDNSAHSFEHSIEVHLPFIACLNSAVKIAPIAVMRASLSECAAIGHAIAETVKLSTPKILIAASSDMSHYVSDERARALDALAIEKMLARDPEGLYEVVSKHKISMCGVLPVAIALFAANELGACRAVLVKYTTSAEISGDYKHVVGYSGLIIS